MTNQLITHRLLIDYQLMSLIIDLLCKARFKPPNLSHTELNSIWLDCSTTLTRLGFKRRAIWSSLIHSLGVYKRYDITNQRSNG